MPDPADPKRRPLSVAPARAGEVPYAELTCRTNFSFLTGASHPDELVSRAAELGYAALAITDKHSVAGVVRAHGAAKAAGLKLLIGATIAPTDAPPTVLLATDRAAYGRLCRLLTRGRQQAPKGECQLSFADLADFSTGLIAGVTSTNDGAGAQRYRELFGDRAYLFTSLHRGPNDALELTQRKQFSQQLGLPLVATNDVHYHTPARRPLADVLTAIRHKTTVAAAGDLLHANAERHLKSPDELQVLFAAAPDAFARTLEIANRCTFSLDELRYEYPLELAPTGLTPLEYLIQLTWAGARERYPAGLPDKVRALLERELALIAELQYENYFLTVYDLVKFARGRNILCQGRGSAANSAVCFCLGVTSVDPAHIEVLFERFISRERNEAPDIDIDFEHERREEVIQYVYERYGRERAGMTAEVITYRPRSAVRDVGKALGLSLDAVDRIAKSLDSHRTLEPARCAAAGLAPQSAIGRQLLALVGQLLGFPRHLGQHVGGLVITQGALCELTPISAAAMPGRTVIEWDKDDLDELGILKVDCLSLGMLTAIRKAFELVEIHHGRPLTLATIPPDDREVYAMMGRAETMGVFQIESRAQMSMLPRLKPQCYYDLVIEVAIVRPGPIQGKMVHPYLRRRMTGEAVPYPNEAIRQVLERTLGVPLFQEQAMQLAVAAAGFTPGEADQLRRAMAAWRRPGVIEAFRVKLMEGMRERGLSTEFAELVFQQINGFGEYGFPESHAASFALLVYASAYLKHHYPAEFCAALLNSQPMGFYAPAQLLREVQTRGVAVRPVDVNHSRWDCTLEAGAIRLGLRMVSGLPRAAAVAIEAAQPFRSLDALRRLLPEHVVARLARADAFASLELGRRAALWQALRPAAAGALLQGLADDEPPLELPALTPHEAVIADYATTGLSLKGHPLSSLRGKLQQLGVATAASLATLPDGQQVKVAGIVLMRQRPATAKGITFVTLEDETASANLIVRPAVWERHYQVARTATACLATGQLQNQQGVIHVLVTRLDDLHTLLGKVRSVSRDFH